MNKSDLTASLQAYHKAGLGGVEITPIYGVIGKEDQFINYLSPQWMEMFVHTLKEAERLDLGIDMATGTGWPFGGPWVSSDDAPKNVAYKTYTLRQGFGKAVLVRPSVFFVDFPAAAQKYQIAIIVLHAEAFALFRGGSVVGCSPSIL